MGNVPRFTAPWVRRRSGRRRAKGATATGLMVSLVAGLLVIAGPAPEAQAAPLSWIDINPDSSDNGGSNAATGGRVNGIGAAPGNNQVFYVASEWGGLFKTTDAGSTWARLDGHLPTATWDVAVDPSSDDHVFATSFYDSRTTPITGIQVSTDAGATWTHPATATPPDTFTNCSDTDRAEPSAFGIGIRPDAPANVFVGTNCGVAISDDFGATWSHVDPTPGDGSAGTVWDVVVQAGGPDGIVDICGADGHLRSTDGGANWVASSNLPAGQCSIAASPDESYVLFAAVGTTAYETDDADTGVTAAWTSHGAIDTTSFSRVSFVTTNQRSDDGDTDRFDLWAGNVNIHRVTCTTPDSPASGGATRCPAGPWTAFQSGAHADSGDIAFDVAAANDACPMLYTSDGGAHRRTGGAPDCHSPSWTRSNVGLHALWLFTMYGVDRPGAAVEDLYMGMQDNGAMYTGQAVPTDADWDHADCCDVFDIVADTTRAVSTFFGGFSFRSRGPGFTGAATELTQPAGCCPLFGFADIIAQYGPGEYAMVTGSGLFITDDITDATPWTQLGATSDPSGGFCSVQVAVDGGTPTFYGFTRCDSGPNSIAENNNPGQLWKFEGEGPSGSWERVDDNGLDGGFHQVAVDPNDPDRLYAADAVGTGFEMVFSTDGGDSWDPDPNLDALMVGDPLQTGDPAFVDRSQVGPTGFTAFAGYRQPTLLAYDPEDPDIIVAGGRDSGVFISSNSGADWALLTDPYTPASSGIPHLPRPRFAYFDHVAGDAALYVGTEGRGIWRADLAEADLSVTKSDSPDPVTAGESLTYAITVTNDGPDPAGNLLLTDPLPAGTTFDSLVAPAGWTCETPDAGDPGTIRCGLSSLAVGVPQAFTVTVDVAASVPDGTVLSNTATIVSNAIDEDQSDNSATETTDVVAEADLVVTKTDDPDPVLAGSELTYTIEVTNDGPSDAQNVEIEDVLPPQTEFKSATPSAGGACVTPPVDTNGTVTCTWAGGTAPGDTRSVDIVVRVISTGPVFDTATTSSDTTDPDPTDNEATAETTVICSITGTPLDDMLVGTQGDDVICGLEGDDKIVGLGGHDFIVGGEGDDDINANDGDDEVRAEGGDDKVYGNDGADLLFGNDGNDALHGGAGLDDIRGGAGDDKCKEGPDGAVLTGCE